MHRIQATLPALGTIPIDFYKESSEVVRMMTEKEFSRLRKVAHLGIVSSIFTGANHSREEYMLLQCAVVGLLSKLHKGNENFALSSTVKLNGITQSVSSGEELLKVWSLLGNYGHAKFTYGLERGLLQAALRDEMLFKWLTRCKDIRDIRDWARRVITEYEDSSMHYVISLARFQFLRQRKYYHYIRNLVLPAEQLFPNDKPAQFKINRLRDLFARIRMLCMATLDSYYSHQPISIQLNSAILGLSEYAPPIGDVSSFERVLTETNSWLAEELYLHPRSCAATKSYEIKAERLIAERFSKAHTADLKKGFLLNLIDAGTGKPDQKTLSPLVRLKFKDQELFESINVNYLSRRLQRQIAFPPKTYVAVNRNPFNGNIYVDILRRNNECDLHDVARLYRNLLTWLLRQLNGLVRKRIAPFKPKNNISSELLDQFKVQLSYLEQSMAHREIENQMGNILRMFVAFVETMLPSSLQSRIKEFVPQANRNWPILIKVDYKGGKLFDQITETLDTHINANPQGLSKDSLQEIKAVNSLVKRSRSKLVILCIEKFTIHDRYNETVLKDELDGIILEFFENEARVTFVEAKNLGSASKNENQAFRQLDNTRKIFSSEVKIRYQRKRITRLGAFLRYKIPIT